MSEWTIPDRVCFGRSPMYVINSIIALAIMIGFKYVVPAADPLTPLGVEILGILLGTLYGWLIVGDVIWPSVVCLILLGLSDYTTVQDAFASGFGNNSVLLMLFFFLFTNILSAAGIIQFIAKWIATRKIAYGKPWVLSLLLMVAAVACFFMVSGTAAFLVMIPLVKSIASLYGFTPGSKWPMAIMFGLVYIGSTSYIILPYKSLPLIVFGVYESSTGTSIPMGPYMIVIAVSIVVSFALFLLFTKFVVRPDVSPILRCSLDASEVPPLSRYQRFVLGYFCVVLLLLILPNLLPATLPVIGTLKSIGNVGILALSIVFFLACKIKGAITLNQLFAHNVAWRIIFLLSAAMAISKPFTAKETGISDWIVSLITPIVAGRSTFVVVIIISVLGLTLVNLANNQAICALFTPIIISIGTALDANLATLVVCMMAACNVGIITPPATTLSALLHNDPAWIPGHAAYSYGLIYSLFNLLNTIFVIYPLCSLLL